MAKPIPGRVYRLQGSLTLVQVMRVMRGKIVAWPSNVDVEVSPLTGPIMGNVIPFGSIEDFEKLAVEVTQAS